MTENPVRWFEIYVQDIARARTFYETVLGVKLERLETPAPLDAPGMELWAFPMEKGKVGAGGTLVKMEGVQSGGNSTLVYFASEDCATEESRVQKAGGQVHRGKMSIGPYGFIMLAVDTEGNMFGVHSVA